MNCTSDVLDERLDFGNCTRTLRRKRVAAASNYTEFSSSPLKTPSKKRTLNSERDDFSSFTPASPFKTPVKKRFGSKLNSEISSSLENLPQDILVKLICFVDHDDLKQLFHVSQIIREATVIAKQWHFAFSTPSSKTATIRSFCDIEDPTQFDIQTPNAPKRCGSYKPRISRKKLNDISVALFHSSEEEVWQDKSGLFMETDV